MAEKDKYIGAHIIKFGSAVHIAPNGASVSHIIEVEKVLEREHKVMQIGGSNLIVMQNGNHVGLAYAIPDGYEMVRHSRDFLNKSSDKGYLQVDKPDIQFEIRRKDGTGESLVINTVSLLES